MVRPTPRLAALAAATALAGGTLLLGAPTTATAAVPPTSATFYASAHGSRAVVGDVTLGKSAYTSVCSPVTGAQYGNNVASADFGKLGKAGAVTTSAATTASKVTVTSKVNDVNLLGGLLQAESITSTSTSRLTGADLATNGSMTFTKLKIAGVPQTLSFAPNSRIELKGVAKVTFNRQVEGTTFGGRKQLTVEAIRIDLLKGNKFGPTKSYLVVAAATSGIHKPTFARASGSAYGSTVNVASLLGSGRTALVGLPCGGSDGQVRTNDVAGVEVPKVLETGAVTSTGQSLEQDGLTTAVLSNTVAGVDILDGLVKADAVTARSSTTGTGTTATSTDQGTLITNLTIAGSAVTVSDSPNTKIKIAKVGVLTTHKVVARAGGQDVIGLELKLTTDQLGLRSGTIIDVAVAKSRVTLD